MQHPPYRKFLLILLLIGFSEIKGQDQETKIDTSTLINFVQYFDENIDLELQVNVGTGLPALQFKEFVKPVRFYMETNFLIGFEKSRRSSTKYGLQLSVLALGSNAERNSGVTTSSFTTLGGISGIIATEFPPNKNWAFIMHGSLGYMKAKTNTSYKLIDRATFSEQVLGIQNEDEINIIANNITDWGILLGLSIGVKYNNFITLQLQNHWGSKIGFIDSNNIEVSGNSAVYGATRRNVSFFAIVLGISLNKQSVGQRSRNF